MEQTIVYQIKEADLQRFQKQEAEKAVEVFISKYNGVLIDSNAVMQIWGVTSATLVSYVKAKYITPINENSSKHLYRLSDILSMQNPKYQRNFLHNSKLKTV